MTLFPGAHAQVYRNEAGEPLGWDYPSDEPCEPDWDEDDGSESMSDALLASVDESEDFGVEDDGEYCKVCRTGLLDHTYKALVRCYKEMTR